MAMKDTPMHPSGRAEHSHIRFVPLRPSYEDFGIAVCPKRCSKGLRVYIPQANWRRPRSSVAHKRETYQIVRLNELYNISQNQCLRSYRL